MNFSCYLRQLIAAGLAFSIVVALTGCGEIDPSEQLAKDRLEQARTAYAQAKANPIVESYSMKSLLEAEKTLQEADQIREKVYSPSPGDSKANDPTVRKLYFDDIARLAYMAERKSQATEALAEGVVTRNELVSLGKEKAEAQLLKSQLEQKLLKQDLDEKASALEQAKQKLSLATSEAERAKILADIQAKEAALAKAQAEAKAKEAEDARALADAHAKDAEKAKAELAQLLKELSELQGQLTDRGIVLTIGDVLFATGKSNLNTSAQRSMDKLAEFLQKNQNRNLLVEGHTDSVGSDEYNQGLSEQRADSVKSALVQRGIATERIVTIGYGKKFPLASNATAAGKQQNRRVEAIILNEGVKPETQFRK
ncbi:MAG: OmpA family protein [Desulfuromonadales bacterium]|nr:OmpA family protein [Desulfuromonadales bacterium]